MVTYRRDVNAEHVEDVEGWLIISDCRDESATADVIAGGSHDVFLVLINVLNQCLELGRTHL